MAITAALNARKTKKKLFTEIEVKVFAAVEVNGAVFSLDVESMNSKDAQLHLIVIMK